MAIEFPKTPWSGGRWTPTTEHDDVPGARPPVVKRLTDHEMRLKQAHLARQIAHEMQTSGTHAYSRTNTFLPQQAPPAVPGDQEPVDWSQGEHQLPAPPEIEVGRISQAVAEAEALSARVAAMRANLPGRF